MSAGDTAPADVRDGVERITDLAEQIRAILQDIGAFGDEPGPVSDDWRPYTVSVSRCLVSIQGEGYVGCEHYRRGDVLYSHTSPSGRVTHVGSERFAGPLRPGVRR